MINIDVLVLQHKHPNNDNVIEIYSDGWAEIVLDGSVHIYTDATSDKPAIEIMSWTPDEYFEGDGKAASAAYTALTICRQHGASAFVHVLGCANLDRRRAAQLV